MYCGKPSKGGWGVGSRNPPWSPSYVPHSHRSTSCEAKGQREGPNGFTVPLTPLSERFVSDQLSRQQELSFATQLLKQYQQTASRIQRGGIWVNQKEMSELMRTKSYAVVAESHVVMCSGGVGGGEESLWLRWKEQELYWVYLFPCPTKNIDLSLTFLWMESNVANCFPGLAPVQ